MLVNRIVTLLAARFVCNMRLTDAVSSGVKIRGWRPLPVPASLSNVHLQILFHEPLVHVLSVQLKALKPDVTVVGASILPL